MPRHRRATPPVLPASLAVGLLGATVLGGAAAPATLAAPSSAAPSPTAVVTSPIPDATLPAPVSVRPREAVTDLGF